MTLGKHSADEVWPSRVSEIFWTQCELRDPTAAQIGERFTCRSIHDVRGIGREAVRRIGEILKDHGVSFGCGCHAEPRSTACSLRGLPR